MTKNANRSLMIQSVLFLFNHKCIQAMSQLMFGLLAIPLLFELVRLAGIWSVVF